MSDQTRELFSQLRIPAIQAPMFLVSGPEMAIAACRAGIMGCFPAPNARTVEILDEWYGRMCAVSADCQVPWAANVIVHPTYPRRDDDLALVLKHQPPLVITALGSPKQVVGDVHAYGGLVFADVVNPHLARKAVTAGVDGLVLVCSGAGGHTGTLSPFVFIDEVRRFFDGPLVIGGGISSGRAVRAVEIMGGDVAYLGTRFIATDESLASDAYKQMVVDASAEDIVPSAAITGVTANWLKPSLLQAGYDPASAGKGNVDFAVQGADNKKWKDIWAAGQCVGASHRVVPVATVVDQLVEEYAATLIAEPSQTPVT